MVRACAKIEPTSTPPGEGIYTSLVIPLPEEVRGGFTPSEKIMVLKIATYFCLVIKPAN